MRNIYLSAILAIPLAVCLSPYAQAGSITGSSILVTSVFDGGSSQTYNFSDLSGTQTEGGIFSWMNVDDAGANIEIIPGTPNGDETRNELEINFSTDATFVPSDTLDLTFQLSPGLVFNQSFFALTKAIDADVPEASATGGTFNVELTGLDQIDGNGGDIQYVFDAENATPEPSTVGLALIGCAILAFKLRRSRSVEQG